MGGVIPGYTKQMFVNFTSTKKWLKTTALQECPSWWRLYEYVSDEERSRLVKVRKEKKDLELGGGGEGYIGDDPWCYNCGGIGHWGDVRKQQISLSFC